MAPRTRTLSLKRFPFCFTSLECGILLGMTRAEVEKRVGTLTMEERLPHDRVRLVLVQGLSTDAGFYDAIFEFQNGKLTSLFLHDGC